MKNSFYKFHHCWVYCTLDRQMNKIPIKYQSELSKPYINLKLVRLSLYSMHVYQYTMVWFCSMYYVVCLILGLYFSLNPAQPEQQQPYICLLMAYFFIEIVLQDAQINNSIS